MIIVSVPLLASVELRADLLHGVRELLGDVPNNN